MRRFCQAGFEAKFYDRQRTTKIIAGLPTLNIESGLNEKNSSVGMFTLLHFIDVFFSSIQANLSKDILY